ncbi:MAG TPA: hypothetical protein VKO86_07560, partial [Gemmatimonadales bacterium]|nr:hypothetical protein [Gemmatimonadales bacterium]
REAFLARRVVKILPEDPCYVLGVVPCVDARGADGIRRLRDLCKAIAQRVIAPFPITILPLRGNGSSVRRKFQALSATRVL